MLPKYHKIIACDFDGTLFTDNYPNIGEPIARTIGELLHEQALGSKVILWTNRSGKELDEAVKACNDKGLFFDAVNDNIPAIIEAFGCNTRKIFANEYWDDRQVFLPWLRHPDSSQKLHTL